MVFVVRFHHIREGPVLRRHRRDQQSRYLYAGESSRADIPDLH